MDPLCHTLVGATLAGTRLGEKSWGATATLLVAANLPDIDVIALAGGGDVSLYWRRGWTHGVLALVVLPVLLTAAVVALGRWRGRSPRPGPLLGLAYLGVWSHPALDWLNTYGVRWAMPFDGTWFYGDALFIIDPWLWLVLGGAACLRFSGSRRSLALWIALALLTSLPILVTAPVPPLARVAWTLGLVGLIIARARLGGSESARSETGRRACTAALVFAVGYIGLSIFTTHFARLQVAEALDRVPSTVYAGPVPANPSARDVVLLDEDAYRPGSFRVGERVELSDEAMLRRADDPRVRAALDAPCVRGLANWLRYPFFEIEETSDGGALVHIVDARYGRVAGEGFSATTVRVDADGRPIGCE